MLLHHEGVDKLLKNDKMICYSSGGNVHDTRRIIIGFIK